MSEFTEKTKRQQSDVFRKAAVLIERQPKLAKARYKDTDGCLCALAALAIANGDEVDSSPYKTPVGLGGVDFFGPTPKEYISTHGGSSPYGTSFENYNNQKHIQNEDVAKGFREIARAIDHGGKFGCK